jgi:hypothetical protein
VSGSNGNVTIQIVMSSNSAFALINPEYFVGHFAGGFFVTDYQGVLNVNSISSLYKGNMGLLAQVSLQGLSITDMTNECVYILNHGNAYDFFLNVINRNDMQIGGHYCNGKLMNSSVNSRSFLMGMCGLLGSFIIVKGIVDAI